MGTCRMIEQALAKGDLNEAKRLQLELELAILEVNDLTVYSLDELDDIAHSLGMWDTIERSFA